MVLVPVRSFLRNRESRQEMIMGVQQHISNHPAMLLQKQEHILNTVSIGDRFTVYMLYFVFGSYNSPHLNLSSIYRTHQLKKYHQKCLQYIFTQ
jgi:hypothetical protein